MNYICTMEHKDKYTGILDMKGIPINNGDDVLVYHHSSIPKEPYKCKVVYKHGWKLTSTDKGKWKGGQDFDVHAWRHSIEVVKTDNESIFITDSYEELKDDWFRRNVSFLITGEERKLLHKCFKEAFELGQEQLHNSLNK